MPLSEWITLESFKELVAKARKFYVVGFDLVLLVAIGCTLLLSASRLLQIWLQPVHRLVGNLTRCLESIHGALSCDNTYGSDSNKNLIGLILPFEESPTQSTKDSVRETSSSVHEQSSTPTQSNQKSPESDATPSIPVPSMPKITTQPDYASSRLFALKVFGEQRPNPAHRINPYRRPIPLCVIVTENDYINASEGGLKHKAWAQRRGPQDGEIGFGTRRTLRSGGPETIVWRAGSVVGWEN